MKKSAEDCPKLCEFCRFAIEVPRTDDMLCEVRGVVGKEYCCRKFVYDPLKRIPRRPPEIIVPEEFE